MEKYSKPEDIELTATQSQEKITERQSERNADFAKEEKTSGSINENITQNQGVFPVKCDREKTMIKSDNPDKNVTQSCQKQQRGEHAPFLF